MRSDPQADKTAASIKRKTAEAKFDKLAKKVAAAPLLEQKTHIALPTEETYVIQMAKAQRAKKAFEKIKADAKSMVADGKVKFDETKTGCVAALVGRSVSKTSFERMIILEARRAAKGEEEVSAEIKGEYWMLKAGGFEAAEQLPLPGLDGTHQKNDAALITRAKKQGIEAGVAAKVSLSDNPHHPGSPQGQSWLQGYHEGQAANASKIGKAPEKPSAKVTSLADVKAKRAKVQEKRGALAPPPVVLGPDGQSKRGRGRPRKTPVVAEAKDGALAENGDPSEMREAAE